MIVHKNSYVQVQPTATTFFISSNLHPNSYIRGHNSHTGSKPIPLLKNPVPRKVYSN